jgi:3-deoxy-D-manno-octulosonic-acid transferase
MHALYNFLIHCYALAISVAATFNGKAKTFYQGRKDLFSRLESSLAASTGPIIWIHASSLGEFEQGRPVIESLKARYSQYKILLTFFSPSGYEVRKGYPLADWVFYLPLDKPVSARKFIQIVQPKFAVFVKYEFWFNYIQEMNKKRIPLFYISAIFRNNQLFFQWYGKYFLKKLQTITWFFVQNEDSYNLLQTNGITQTSIAGDTRFDRVFSIAQSPKDISEIEHFIQGKTVMVVGSSWNEDISFLKSYINDSSEMAFIIAPHQISTNGINFIKQQLTKSIALFSSYEVKNHADVLIIDNVGMLSSLYRYAKYAYIGGGFGDGLHNILEAVVYGVPVFFGNKNYKKFNEAEALHARGVAFPVDNPENFNRIVGDLEKDLNAYKRISENARNFIEENRGTTEKILKGIEGIMS